MSSNPINKKTICSCVICNIEISVNNLEKHYNSKACLRKKNTRKQFEIGLLICPFCNRECKNHNSMVQHAIRCKNNPNKIESKPSFGMKGKKGANQFTKAKRLGLPTPIVSEETRNKISNSNTGMEWSLERRMKHSKSMKLAAINNPQSYSGTYNRGKVKSYEYCGFKVIGKWELAFLTYCLDNSIKIIQPTVPFPYEWNESIHSYYPDFYLPDFDVYVEVKGMLTEKDSCKIQQFPHKIKLIMKKEIIEINNNIFDINQFMVGQVGFEPTIPGL